MKKSLTCKDFSKISEKQIALKQVKNMNNHFMTEEMANKNALKGNIDENYENIVPIKLKEIFKWQYPMISL